MLEEEGHIQLVGVVKLEMVNQQTVTGRWQEVLQPVVAELGKKKRTPLGCHIALRTVA
jgi:hypothetical protein